MAGVFVYADLIRFWRIRKNLIEHTDDIDRLVYLTGSVDALIAMSGYVESHSDHMSPSVFGDSTVIDVRDVWHPLLDDPVPNSITVDRSILLTGANASGKSTFLKSMALAAIYAQTFGYVCAGGYHAPICLVSSAMSVKDDVTSGDSYYMAEIKAVKRMMDEYRMKQDNGVSFVCFVDELLSGTNTEERIAACTGILQSMDTEGVRVFAATHDIELTYLLADTYANYHFMEDLSDGDVKFSYKLQDGPATSRNAIRLLQMLGFDEGIVDKAMDMVKRHGEEGIWSCSQKGSL
jgi:DNA mismatch repair ATPase MutS